MELDEAVAIQQYVLQGKPVQVNQIREAKRVVRAHEALTFAQQRFGENHAWMPSPLSTTQRERVNMILAYRLGVACGLFTDWSST